jgi:hypothetical protein
MSNLGRIHAGLDPVMPSMRFPKTSWSPQYAMASNATVKWLLSPPFCHVIMSNHRRTLAHVGEQNMIYLPCSGGSHTSEGDTFQVLF